MSVDYTPILAIGIEFKSEAQAVCFLRGHDLLSAQDVEDIGKSCLEEYLPCNMDGGCLDLYSGYGYYIGYRLRCYTPTSFKRDFEAALSNWGKAFNGEVMAELIHTIRIS